MRRTPQHYIFALMIMLSLLAFVRTANAETIYTVRTIYFQPTDAPPLTRDYFQLIFDVQDFYRDQMEQHGYGPKTFTIDTTDEGHFRIHIVKGKHPAIHYISDTYNQLVSELPFDFRRQSVVGQNNIHLIIVAGLDRIDNSKLGVGFPYSQFHSGGTALVAGYIASQWIIAHELGHAFGLFHTGKVGALMSIRGKDVFLDYEARWLAKHHAFNETHIKTDVPERFTDLPIEAIGGGTIRFRIVATSKSGLYHCQLCRKRGTYILGYDDSISRNSDIIEIDASRGRLINGDDVWFQVMDVNGNYTFHHQTRITLPAPNNEKLTNEKPNIVLPPEPEPEPEPKPEIEVEIEEAIDCPDCMPDGMDTPIDDDLSVNPIRVRLLTTQWAALKQR